MKFFPFERSKTNRLKKKKKKKKRERERERERGIVRSLVAGFLKFI